MQALHIAVLDPDPHTRDLLLSLLRQAGFASVKAYTEIPADAAADVLLCNLPVNDTTTEQRLRRLKRDRPQAAIIILCAPGPSLRAVQAWQGSAQLIETVLSKPLQPQALRDALHAVQQRLQAQHALLANNRRLASNLTGDAVRAMLQDNNSDRIEQRAILFTDVRGSTALLESLSATHFFSALNSLLTAQSACVRENEGEVIKFTGDGMMATFSGFGHAYRAVRCARQLQDLGRAEARIQFGIGLAEGLVMCGFVGDDVRRQYDVLGANVHLAARLCSQAKREQILLPETMWQRTGLNNIPRRTLGELPIKGFSKPVACVALDLH